MASSKDYVLGTHDEEIERLGLQHRVWQQRAFEGWRSAGIGPGQTVLDVGCGPGYAALDLAELVGASGGLWPSTNPNDSSARWTRSVASVPPTT